MLTKYFGFQEEPFGATPDPRWLYRSAKHREALSSLRDGYYSNRGFTALIAAPGLGKTTLLFQFLHDIRNTSRIVFLFDTQCEPLGLLRYILRDLGVAPAITGDEMHLQLEAVLVKEAREERTVVVVVDEAQNLSCDALEMLRLLTNYETPRAKMLHIVLSGQQRLGDILLRPSMEQLRQRVSSSCWLEPFSIEETTAYIRHRLEQAGYRGAPLFRKDALRRIMLASHGIPRLINNHCFNALELCREQKCLQVDMRMAAEAIAIQELDPEERKKITDRWLASDDHSRRLDQALQPQKPIAFSYLFQAQQPPRPAQAPEHLFRPDPMFRPAKPVQTEQRLRPEKPPQPEVRAEQPSQPAQPIRPEQPLHPEPLLRADKPVQAEEPLRAEVPPQSEIQAEKLPQPALPIRPEQPLHPEPLFRADKPVQAEEPLRVDVPLQSEIQAEKLPQPALPIRSEQPLAAEPLLRPEKPLQPELRAEQPRPEFRLELSPKPALPIRPELFGEPEPQWEEALQPAEILPYGLRYESEEPVRPEFIGEDDEPDPAGDRKLVFRKLVLPSAAAVLLVASGIGLFSLSARWRHGSRATGPVHSQDTNSLSLSRSQSSQLNTSRTIAAAPSSKPSPFNPYDLSAPVSSQDPTRPIAARVLHRAANAGASFAPSAAEVVSVPAPLIANTARVSSAAAASKAAPFQITVVRTQSLRDISVRYLGVWDQKRQHEIEALNPDLTDVDHIPAGQTIWLPAPEPAPISQPFAAQAHLNQTPGTGSNANVTKSAIPAAIRNASGGAGNSAALPHKDVAATGIGSGTQSGSNAKVEGKVAPASLPAATASARAVSYGKVASAGISAADKEATSKGAAAPASGDVLSSAGRPNNPAEP